MKVEVRLIGALTGPPTPWRLPSPAWMARVWAPSWCAADFALGYFLEVAVLMMGPFCAAVREAAKHQIGDRVTNVVSWRGPARSEIRVLQNAYQE